jgi:hypothetical protein
MYISEPVLHDDGKLLRQLRRHGVYYFSKLQGTAAVNKPLMDNGLTWSVWAAKRQIRGRIFCATVVNTGDVEGGGGISCEDFTSPIF